jgi:hypothetical protein
MKLRAGDEPPVLIYLEFSLPSLEPLSRLEYYGL